VHAYPEDEDVAVSISAVTALADWWNFNQSYGPAPVLMEPSPCVTYWFAVAIVTDCRSPIKCEAEHLLNELARNVWLATPPPQAEVVG
jgi:hypothetical protein